MDLNVIRITITLLTMGAFLGIVYWAFAPKRRGPLNEQGRSILEDDR